MTGPACSAVLSAADIAAITGLLTVIGGWPLLGAIYDDLRARGTALPGGNLPGHIAWLTVMLPPPDHRDAAVTGPAAPPLDTGLDQLPRRSASPYL